MLDTFESFNHLNFGACATWIQVVDKRAQQPLQLALTFKELSVAGHDSFWFR